jgi:hypothetical protein
MTQTLPLRCVAHARTGDKGDLCNIAVIAWHPALYPVLTESVTQERVAAFFSHRHPRSVRRYLLPRLGALNLVLDGVLDGGVTESMNLDAHGKSLSFLLLSLPVRVPNELLGFCRTPSRDSRSGADVHEPGG